MKRMIKQQRSILYGVLVIFYFFNPASFAGEPTPVTANVNSKGVLIDGYDVVSYFKEPKPLKGKDQYKLVQNGVTYLFSSEENQQAFMKDPKKYEPQFGGWCAYAVAEKKEKVEVDPESYLIQDGRLLLFYNSVFARTKKSWEDPKGIGKEAYLKLADKNWPEIMNRKP